MAIIHVVVLLDVWRGGALFQGRNTDSFKSPIETFTSLKLDITWDVLMEEGLFWFDAVTLTLTQFVSIFMPKVDSPVSSKRKNECHAVNITLSLEWRFGRSRKEKTGRVQNSVHLQNDNGDGELFGLHQLISSWFNFKPEVSCDLFINVYPHVQPECRLTVSFYVFLVSNEWTQKHLLTIWLFPIRTDSLWDTPLSMIASILFGILFCTTKDIFCLLFAFTVNAGVFTLY